jgi:hypothetical protein
MAGLAFKVRLKLPHLDTARWSAMSHEGNVEEENNVYVLSV